MSTTVGTITHYINVFTGPESFRMRKLQYKNRKVYNEKYRDTRIRKKSLGVYYHENKLQLANNGIYLQTSDNKDSLFCIYCIGAFSYDEMSMNYNPKHMHRKKYPMCPFLLNLDVSNSPMKGYAKVPDFDNDIEILHNNIRHRAVYETPDYVTEEVELLLSCMKYLDIFERQKTFRRRCYFKQVHLAKSGLYLIDDIIICVQCKFKHSLYIDGVLELEDHLYHYTHCQYRKSKYTSIKSGKIQYPIMRKYKIDLSNIDASIDKFGIVGINREVIYHKYQFDGKGFDSNYEMILSSYNKPSPRTNNIKSIIYKDSECVVCYEGFVDGVFLPCGHLCACYSCDSRLTNCPKCRSVIDSVVYNIRINNM